MEKLTQEDIGYWLKIARESIGLNQEDVAIKMGIPRSAISLIEAGKRSVTSIELDQFANLYRRPVSFFLRKRSAAVPEEEPFSVLLRAEIVTEQDRPELISLHEFFKRYAALERMVFGGISYEVPEYLVGKQHRRYRTAIEEGEHLAVDERGGLGLGNAPIPDLYGILELEGIKIFKKPFAEDSKISGCFFFTVEVGPCIVVNTAQRQGRTNFTAAHEYCHFLRDRHTLSDYACDLRHLGAQQQLFEIRANAFAAAFLMPTDGVNEYLKELGASKKRPLSVDQVVKVQRYLGVSYLAMLYRLKNLGWLNDEEMESLKGFKPTKVAKRLGFDPEKRDDDLEFPPRYIYLAVEAYRKGKISLGKFSELLNLPREEATDFLKSLKVKVRLGPGTEEELLEEIAGA